MDRRAFLRALGFGTVAAAAAATSVFDLERLLWVPGEKTIFLPSAPAIPAAVSDPLTGISIRFIQHWDIQLDTRPTRFDDFIRTHEIRRPRPPNN
jgi:hypothetical protein